MKKIANHLRHIGAKLTGPLQPAHSRADPTLSVVALDEHGQPVRIPINELKGSMTGKYPKPKAFTDTVVFDAGKAE